MKKFLLVITMLFSLSIMSRDRLDDVMEVLKYVESFNDPSAIGDGGDSYGVLQIQKACVDDVNRYYKTNYTHGDMFQVECAEEVFKLYAEMGIRRYINKYGAYPSTEIIVRNHNGGIYSGYRRSTTKKYYRRYLLWKSIINNKQYVKRY